MKILLTGSSGFVGSSLVAALREKGHDVVRLVREKSSEPRTAFWNPDAGELDARIFDGVDAVIHLAGENVAARRWSAEQRTRLLESRVKSTSLLTRTILSLSNPPKTVISASAIGYYGSHGDRLLDESSPPGDDFLAEVCRQWELAAAPLAGKTRLVFARIGVVLNKEGGALQKMLFPFRLGLGGPVGDGRNYISWIARTDLVRALIHCLETSSVTGPIDLVAPHPATNAELTAALARAVNRPAFFRVPRLALLLVFGEMAEQTILSSMRVKAEKLIQSGFSFTYPDLAAALQAELS